MSNIKARNVSLKRRWVEDKGEYEYIFSFQAPSSGVPDKTNCAEVYFGYRTVNDYTTWAKHLWLSSWGLPEWTVPFTNNSQKIEYVIQAEGMRDFLKKQGIKNPLSATIYVKVRVRSNYYYYDSQGRKKYLSDASEKPPNNETLYVCFVEKNVTAHCPYDYIELGKAPKPTFEYNDDRTSGCFRIDDLYNVEGGTNCSFLWEIYKDGLFFRKETTSLRSTGSGFAESFDIDLTPGSKYEAKVRLHSTAYKVKGPWSDFSDEYSSGPPKMKTPTLQSLDENTIRVNWQKPSGDVSNYIIRYAEKKEYLDYGNQYQDISDIDKEALNYIIGGLTSGKTYYFKIRAKNEISEGEWSDIASVSIGTTPDIPTTWSSKNVIGTHETIVFYWVHNSKDNSKPSSSELQFCTDEKGTELYKTTTGFVTDEDITSYTLYNTENVGTKKFPLGVDIYWRVRTKGVTNNWGPYSPFKILKIYSEPKIYLTTNMDSDTLTKFPLKIHLRTDNLGINQHGIGYEINITSLSSYNMVDQTGKTIKVSVGDVVYNHYSEGIFDGNTAITHYVNAGDISLYESAKYKIRVTAYYNSGLEANVEEKFDVNTDDYEYVIDAARPVYDPEECSVSFTPYCYNTDVDGNATYLNSSVDLYVYRINNDGSLTLIADKVKNDERTSVFDPHPPLNYALYRIVAVNVVTGKSEYTDLDPIIINRKSLIFQWEEIFNTTYTENESIDDLENPIWSKSYLELKYNIDISNDTKTDVSLVKYIGRSNPISYYGTHIDNTQTWSVDIDKKDAKTMFGIRRLAQWLGDVYVREPSGNGFWANVDVSYTETHNSLVIPVRFSITKVEGGK